MDVLSITLPIFALIGLGYIGVKAKLFDSQVGAGLSRFVFWLAFPSLLLVSMAKAPPPDTAMASQLSMWLAVLVSFQFVGRVSAHVIGLDKSSQAGIAMAASCGNTAFLGTAILTSLIGTDTLALVAAFVAVENIIVVGLGVVGLKSAGGSGGKWSVKLKTLVTGMANPTSVGALIGFIASLSGQTIPAYLLRPLEMLGGAASPTGLVALGVVMATLPRTGGIVWREIGLVVVLKNLFLPVAMFWAFTAIGAPSHVIVAATLLAACPSAVNVFIQAKQADVWAGPAALAVMSTTLVSIVGVSVVAAMWQS